MDNKRLYWGKKNKKLPKLDLTLIQRESWDWFLKHGIQEAIEEINPIEDFTGKNWLLEFGSYSLSQPEITPSLALRKGLSFTVSMKIKVRLTNKKNGTSVDQEVFMGDFPLMTERGTFVINGIERGVVSQIVRSPGVYFSEDVDVSTGKYLYQAELRPMRGSWLEFEITKHDLVYVRIDRRRKFPITTFLRAIGYATDEEIKRAFQDLFNHPGYKYLEATMLKDTTRSREEALIEIYKRFHPGEPAILDNAENLLFNMFFNPRRYDLSRVGRHKVTKRLKISEADQTTEQTLTPTDILYTAKYLLKLQAGEGRADDIDHLANRRIRRVGELVAATALRIGLLRLERAIKEKMSLMDPEEEVNTNLINARPVIAAINEFFRSNQLSTIIDQTNPLSELDNLRRISVMGPGGITRERASFSIRDINSSQYGRICPVRSPEGPNIGLVTYLSLFTRVNEFGFLETPYYKVEPVKKGNKTVMKITDELVYMTADDEEEHHITHADIEVDDDGVIQEDWVPIRFQGEFTEGSVDQVQLIDITPRQVVGAAASLIPFLANDDSIRALMGTHMQCQAVPLVRAMSPVVGTGMEGSIAESMNWVVKSRHAGTVKYVDAGKVVIELNKKPEKIPPDTEYISMSGSEETYLLTKFKRSSQSTCYNQRAFVKVGDRVKVGDTIIDGPACHEGELSLGQNLLIGYASFEGLGYEDAIAISDRVVKEDLLTSIHIEEHTCTVVDTKLGPEELTRDIPNVSEQELSKLSEDGIITIGSEVEPGDILVGKIAPKGETEPPRSVYYEPSLVKKLAKSGTLPYACLMVKAVLWSTSRFWIEKRATN
jgi:DNA-directed RNA polymerase subunit beta